MGKYTHIWEQHVCKRVLKVLSSNGSDKWSLSSELFKEVGNRKVAGYNVSVIFINGKCSQQLGGSAVARDLRDVIANAAQSSQYHHLFSGKTIIMKMGKSFDFSVECSKNSDITSNILLTPISETTHSTKISSFPPIVDEQSKILILGTMPGNESLATGEYYAKKGNTFWNIISTIFNDGNAFSTYEKKIECVTKHHIAIWDALRHCQREGSTDNTITKEEHNDIDAFLKQYPKIKKIVFNGKKALIYYKPSIQYSVALSTSPANCRYSKEEKIDSWRQAMEL